MSLCSPGKEMPIEGKKEGRKVGSGGTANGRGEECPVGSQLHMIIQ